jgi:hypothetical protein
MPADASFDLSWFTSPRDETQLRKLDEAIDDLADKPVAAEEFKELLGVFERFPEDDGHGVFWSIVHCLEAFDGYEPFLVESVNRNPVEFNVLMVNRLLNAGVLEVGNQSLLALLKSVVACTKASSEVRESAADLLEYQKQHGRE